jgi:hypothetical protein
MKSKEGPDMTAHRIVLNLVVAVSSIILVQGAVSAQEYRGTSEQQMACTPDVFRLCGAQIPDVNRIVGCLRENTALLSRPCRAVFDSGGSASQPSPGRAARPAPATQPGWDDDDD